MDYINIGAVPYNEECAQVGSEDYTSRASAECLRFIRAIRKVVGKEPMGAYLVVKAFPHDFGFYHEVVCCFEEGNDEALSYALKCEDEAPAQWPEEI